MRLFKLLPHILLLSLLMGCSNTLVREANDATGEAGSIKQKGDSRAELYTSLAMEYMKQGRLDIALQKIKQGVQADPKNSNAHNVMGLIYQRLGQTGLAEDHLKRAVSLDRHNFYALNAYGSFLCGLKRYGEAYVNFDNAVKNPLNNNKEIALANAGICAHEEGHRDRAETYLREALAANARHAPALAQMAEVSYDAGDFMSARTYLRRYLQVAQHSPKTLWLGIRTERKLGDRDTEASYRMLLRNNYPDSKEFRLMRELEQQSG
ncbi:MAG: type IV pilus biogenesis/stability protein PilW [Gammaproteobacteria bacterium]|nr:type IV pilus biogenesis/stability protein PilW [Gammaproteobacteria bacterium]MBU1655668.1 type IV pilus biogenesis/stability protein PilW [Gammaproteobacteria bacterium]MBU1960321.1 type IV pilus biogenesis/stability protein PilW [Gammaproteobacteria bacterium]